MASIDEIISDFEVVDDWEDRYRYIIELGKKMPALADVYRTEGTKVRGCASQVWIRTEVAPGPAGEPHLTFTGDSDAIIVRGLIAVLLALYSGKSASEILSIDAKAVLARLGLDSNLSQQRSNGLNSMIERIRADARAALDGRA
jgi:cysteine desulfuration protein SufE